MVSPVAYDRGGLVEIRLLLRPEEGRIQGLARVVQVEPRDGGFRNAFEFTHLREADREAIIKHVHAVQMRQLQRQAQPEPRVVE